MGKVTIKVISTDYVFQIECIGEHGNTILVENDHGKVLFDTGQGLALEHNLKVLGWNLDNLDAIAISHGHNDHIGGLIEALKCCDKDEVPVYGHKEILADRIKVYSWGEGSTGSPYTKQEFEAAGAKFIFNERPVELVKGITLTGPIPRSFAKNNTKAHFQVRNGKKVQDPFHDDQALIVETSKGLVILYGCAHAGVINTMNFVEKLTGERKFYGLFGGTHLLTATEDELNDILAQIEKRGVQKLGFNHCTGLHSIAYFMKNFSGNYLDASTGFSIEI